MAVVILRLCWLQQECMLNVRVRLVYIRKWNVREVLIWVVRRWFENVCLLISIFKLLLLSVAVLSIAALIHDIQFNYCLLLLLLLMMLLLLLLCISFSLNGNFLCAALKLVGCCLKFPNFAHHRTSGMLQLLLFIVVVAIVVLLKYVTFVIHFMPWSDLSCTV